MTQRDLHFQPQQQTVTSLSLLLLLLLPDDPPRPARNPRLWSGQSVSVHWSVGITDVRHKPANEKPE
ncbi:hypothetical protein E2C01_017430 [Portunus trituberculatus]|uniref:Uncharacterized protein n=1 Tax=Portunus trituberculatus TaxID=210409 RepID=A0A5B7DTF3_PORTR|nr:hypothetical protein [Portunus trituberculatus]